MTKRIFFFCFTFFLLLLLVSSGSFNFDSDNFYMNDLPYIIRSGEMHYARIPPEYWTHRIQMVKSMGMNTIATYVFWNFHQPTPDKFDFESPTHNLREFIEKVHKEGLNILLRPGPYTCAEWDFGGLPFWLLKYEGIRVRCLDPIYMLFVEKYIEQLSKIIREYQITEGFLIKN